MLKELLCIHPKKHITALSNSLPKFTSTIRQNGKLILKDPSPYSILKNSLQFYITEKFGYFNECEMGSQNEHISYRNDHDSKLFFKHST
jgi:hypothetical protein